MSEPTRVLGVMLRDVLTRNAGQRNFRVFGPDETESNRLGAVLEVTGKTWEEATLPVDVNLATDGRVMEILSSTPARAGSRELPTAGTARFPVTRRSSTSSTRCSTSTPSG